VDLGRIGREVARLLGAFGARMVGYDPYVADLPGVELMELDDLLATADAVGLHSPLLPETRGMIGAKQLAHMKPDAVLVNTLTGPARRTRRPARRTSERDDPRRGPRRLRTRAAGFGTPARCARPAGDAALGVLLRGGAHRRGTPDHQVN
jgi:hypothetical protein